MRLGLGPADVRLSMTRTGLNDHALSIKVSQRGRRTELHSATLFNIRNLQAIATDLIDQLNVLINDDSLTLEALEDPLLVDTLGRLNAAVFAARIAGSQEDLGDLLERVLKRSETPPYIVIDLDAGMFPWEFMSPARTDGIDHMLGSRAYIVGALDPAPASKRSPLGIAKRLKTRRATGRGRSTFSSSGSLRLRGVGHIALRDAQDEERLILNPPSPLASGTMSPAITNLNEEAEFFIDLRKGEYDVVHVFAHCGYRARSFELEVSTGWPLAHNRFDHHRARFPEHAFHFLNVCEGAPTPATLGASFLEYVHRRHGASGIVASLAMLRSRSAAAMATAFYSEFLPQPQTPGAPAAAALFRARQALRARGLADGYLYRMFGRGDVAHVPFKIPRSLTTHG